MITDFFESQLKWKNFITHSIPNWENYPSSHLSIEEHEFGEWLQTFKIQDYYKLITSEELAKKVKEIWDWLLHDKTWKTIKKHLVKLQSTSSNKSYLNREYRIGKKKYGLWLFSKGLICGYEIPKKGVRCEVKYSYPVTKYSLIMKNFVKKYPPHNWFASLCSIQLQESIGSNVLRKVDPTKYSIPYPNGSGNYVADNCYCINFNGQDRYLWQEIHTGSENYNQDVFLKRLVVMEKFLAKEVKNGYYVIFVPFVRDKIKAMQAIDQFNHMEKTTNQRITMERIFIVPYTQIAGFKERLGIYNHQTR